MGVHAPTNSGLRLNCSLRLSPPFAVTGHSLRSTHEFKACRSPYRKGLFSSAQPYGRRKPAGSRFLHACAQTTVSTPNVNQPEQDSARLFESPALWLLASAAATFYLSKVIDGKGLMLLSSLLVYKLSQWPVTSLWSMISVMVVACYRPALALWLGAMVAMATALFKTSALELIRLQYPLYYGIVRIPKVMADWIMHNASLTSYVNSTLAWGPWVLFSLAVCLQCAIWIASIMRIQRPQQSASVTAHGLRQRRPVSSESPGVPAPGAAAAAAAAASVPTAAAPAPVSDADTPASAATSPASGTVASVEENRAGTGTASATIAAPTAAATASEAAGGWKLSLDSDGNSVIPAYVKHSDGLETPLSERIISRTQALYDLTWSYINWGGDAQQWKQLETEIEANMPPVEGAAGSIVHKWMLSVAQTEIQDKANGEGDQTPLHAQDTHNWLLSAVNDAKEVASAQAKLLQRLQRASELCNLQQAIEALAIERDCLQDKLKAAASHHEAAMAEQQSKTAAAVQKAAGNGLQEAKQRAEALQAKLTKAQEQQASLEQQVMALDKQLAAANASEAAQRLRDVKHINRLQADWEDVIDQRHSLQKQLESLQSDLRHAQAGSKHANALQLQVGSLQEQLTAAIAQLSDSAAQIDSLQKQLTAAKGKVTEGAAQGQGQVIHQAEVWAAQKKALSKHIRELQAAQAKAAEDRAARAAELDKANAGITAAQYALRHTEQKYVTTAFALDKAQASLKETHTQLAQAQAELQDTHTKHDVALAELKDALLRQREAAELQAAADSTAKAEALSKLKEVELQRGTEVSRTQELQRRVQELVAQSAKDESSTAEALAKLHKAELEAAEGISQLQHRAQQAEKQAEEEANRSLELSNHVREFAAQSAADHDRAKDAQGRLEEVGAQLTEERDRVHKLQRRVQRLQQEAAADRAEQQELARAVVALEDKPAERDGLQGLLEQQASQAAKIDVSNDAPNQEIPKAASPAEASDADFWDLPHPGVSPDWKGPASQPAQAFPPSESATEVKMEVAETRKEVNAEAVESAKEAEAGMSPSFPRLSPELAAEWDHARDKPAKALADTVRWYQPKKPTPPITAAAVLSEDLDDGEGEVEVVVEGQGSVSNAGAGNGIASGQDAKAAARKGTSFPQLSPELAAEWEYARDRPAKALGDRVRWYSPKDVQQPGKPVASSTAAAVVSENVADGEGEVEVVIEGQGSVSDASTGNGI